MILAFQPASRRSRFELQPSPRRRCPRNRIRRDDRHSRAQQSRGWRHSLSRSSGVVDSPVWPGSPRDWSVVAGRQRSGWRGA